MAVLGVAHYESTATSPAIHGTFQVVGVFALLLSGDVSGREKLLNSLPGFGTNKWLVLALVQHAPVADDAHVIRMTKQAL
jgi:hypothetical protein